MNPAYPAVAQRAEYRCEYCHAPEGVFNFPFEVEHILPKSLGGDEDDSNRALACRSCNLRKGVQQNVLDIVSETLVPLFNPRDHRWAEHFRAELETGLIAGTTAIGRATVVALVMNSAAQLKARRQWMRLGLFP
jgi:hypothetical protein